MSGAVTAPPTALRTRDIMHEGGRLVGTRGMGDAVLEWLERVAESLVRRSART